MIHTTQGRSIYQLFLTIMVASAFMLVGLTGCESESDAPSGLGAGPSGQQGTSGSGGSGGQTAPSPDTAVQESQLIGCWSPDVNADQPSFIDFYYQDGKLRYDYYQMLLGDGSGFGLANGHTKFEYNNGEVVFYGNQGTCQCLVTNSDKVYIAFYLDSIADGVIADQSDGDLFYYVGAQCPISDDYSSSSSSGSGSSSGSSASTYIGSPDDARNYLYGLLVDGGHEVPPYLEYDHMSGDGYVIHGYELVDDGASVHTGTWFWYTVYPDGTIYDEILQTEVSL
jgi:hypothetical protein